MKFLLTAIATVALLCIAGGAWIGYQLNQPYQGFSEPVFVDFERGTSSTEMASVLAQKGVVRNDWLFLAARALRRDTNLQAGEYRLDKPASPLDVFGRISRGDIYYLELLVPEGNNMFDISELVTKLGFIKGDAFLAAARNPALVHELLHD